MKHVWLAITLGSVVLAACGGEPDSDAGEANDDAQSLALTAETAEEPESFDDLPYGEFSTSLTDAEGSGRALCDAVITRIPSDELANITVSLSVIGESCDPTGRCESDNDRNGDFSYTGGVESDKDHVTMTLGYEPPGMTGRDILWMYDTVLNPSPSSRFELLVDGDAYDIQSGDLKGINNLGSGPHYWSINFSVAADIVNAAALSKSSQARATFSYTGPCEFRAVVLQ